MAAEPILRLEGLTKRFPGVVALAGVALDIADGELHALALQTSVPEQETTA